LLSSSLGDAFTQNGFFSFCLSNLDLLNVSVFGNTSFHVAERRSMEQTTMLAINRNNSS
jgi:hypothetical protein